MKILWLCALALMPFFAQTLKPSYSLQKDLITSQDLFPEAPYFVIGSFLDHFELEIPSQTLEKLFKEHQFPLEKSRYEAIKLSFIVPFETKKAQEEIAQAFRHAFASFHPEITKISLKPLSELKAKEIKVLGAKVEQKAFKKKKFSLMLEVWMDGEKSLIPFLSEIEASLDVFVASEEIKAGEDLNAENVIKKRMDFEGLITLPALKDQIYTSSSRSFIPKGSIIFASKLKPQIIIKRGDWIEALFQEDHLMIQVRLQAMQNASLGQEINAKNPQSQKIIRVKIIAKGKGIVQ